jgi:outer membrane protein
MKARGYIIFVFFLLHGIFQPDIKGQDTTWTLQTCIQYALKQNIQVRKTDLTSSANLVYTKQARAGRYPSFGASVRQNLAWNNIQDSETKSFDFKNSNSTNYSLNSSVSVFNGLRISNRIKQTEINLESGKYNSETTKESISLSILNAYLQVLYAEELVNNSHKQVEATNEQLNLAEERLALSIISRSDYLQIKSQLAGEKYTLASAESQYAIARVNLMQLMELQVSDSFFISHPNLEGLIFQHRQTNADLVYQLALSVKPQVKSAQLNRSSALLDEKIAKADYWPELSLDANVGTGYSSLMGDMNYNKQLDNKLNPTIGLSLSIPIYQKRQIKSQVDIARIGIQNAELDEINVKNQLRKDIEQACVDVHSAQIKFEASLEQYQATNESYMLASEKFRQGIINSVDFLFEKTKLIVTESELLQSKYNLIFSYKILDFYSGIPLTL